MYVAYFFLAISLSLILYITPQKSLSDLAEDDWRRRMPRINEANFPNIVKLAEQVQAIGKKYNATPGQVALAWLLAQGDDIIPIPGTKKLEVRRWRYSLSTSV
jgi:aryl-alcohol dehydrogenase-like predicted oxidoreductase